MLKIASPTASHSEATRRPSGTRAQRRIVAPLAGMIILSAGGAALGDQYAGTELYPLAVPAGSSANISGAAASGVVGIVLNEQSYAVTLSLWNGSTSSPVNLGPSGAQFGSQLSAISGSQEVGRISNGGEVVEAAVWNGSASSYVDLNPNSNTTSEALGTNGSQQVGDVTNSSGVQSATIWNGTAASFVSLANPGEVSSVAIATNGSQQVGWGETGYGTLPSAYLWSGTASSRVNLNGSFDLSEAVGISPSGNQQVGYAGQGISESAVMWTGTAASVVVLFQSAGLSEYGTAVATNGSQQVGYLTDNPGLSTAALWSGTAASYINLGALLPTNLSGSSSFALSIDAQGNVFGYAQDTSGNDYAVEWQDVSAPEPGVCSLLLTGACGLLVRSRRTKPAQSA